MALRNIQVITDLPFNVKPIQDITDTLPSRLPDPEPYRTKDQITHISVHHSAVEGGTIQGYANTHVNTNGWAHIGYHTVIKGDQIYQTNDLLTFAYHTSSNNAYTVSVSISGDLSKRALTTDERNCLYAVILTYMDIFGIPAENVWGHNQFPGNNTACPSIDMSQVRSDVKNIQMKMQKAASWEEKMKEVASIINQINYLTNLMKLGEKDGNAIWALNSFQDVARMMREKHLL